ncbi:DUF6973 domain-containing protein [Gordonia soli]|uniref:DUF6973 domain-containing protein n=1 Tax=Gordonia soli TaxID=320799 RepID=UPI0012F7BBFB|nr:hypothetical protein [Gordonia soli]
MGVVRSWDFDSAQTVAAGMSEKSGELLQVGNATGSVNDSSGDYWKGFGGGEARSAAAVHREELSRSAKVVGAVADTASSAIRVLDAEVTTLRAKLQEVDDSEYELSVTDEGKVYSRKSNAQWKEEWGFRTVYKLPAKEADEFMLTEEITTGLARIKEADQNAGEKLRGWLEKLSDGVKKGVVAQPSDPRLRRILADYQTRTSHGAPRLWPDPTTMARLKHLGVSMEPKLLTPEEISMLKKLVLTSPGAALAGKPTIGDFQRIENEAKAAAAARFPEELDDGKGDAFRHAYWNALMTKTFGADWARQYATAHEGLGGQPAHREAMDLYNNETGRKVAAAHPDASDDELADLIASEVHHGATVSIGGDGYIDWTNRVVGAPKADSVGVPLPARGD